MILSACRTFSRNNNVLKAKSSKQYRWHPMIIRWCLHLRMFSSTAYNAIRSSGIIITLLSYRQRLHQMNRTGVEIQPEVTAQLVQEALESTSQKDLRSCVAVVFDNVTRRTCQ